MKVLHLNAGNETGGGMHHILGLMKRLDKEQFILGVMEKGELFQRAKAAGINTIHFGCSNKLSIPLVRKLKVFMMNENISFLHTHGPRANVYASILKKLVPFRWVVTVHSNPLLDFMGKGIYGKLLSNINIRAMKQADKLIAISDPFTTCLIESGILEEKITTELNGIDFKQKHGGPTYKKAEFGIPEEDFLILMVARLDPVKGHAIAFKAFAQLLAACNTCHLLVVGDGALFDKLKRDAAVQGLEKNIHFLGHRNDIDSLYKMADVTLLTSLSESFPLVLLESARVQTPIIATDVGGVSQLITDKSLGWKVSPGDASEVALALKEAFNFYRKGMLPLMGEKLYSHASSKFTLEKFAENVYNVYLGMKNVN
ncbi:glycosyltransferase family 4 protein [Virgibacillus halodenitrificans]|uniref:glycosyltransferase family 4 protein n=1 Tax=Virgibacillus halodenitrificans TaxID=1482 RepID=UPI001F404C1C|nr:glycosyltransferase family 4 protein [Virgibacillus halodenitrificans]MCG1028134.1 glycosyltransferase family 4 protein [Virgibacillus halodenitrificans]